MSTDYDTIIRLRLISYTINYSDTSTIDVTFSDAIRVHDIYEDASSIQAQANSSALSFQFNKDQYDKTAKQGNFVAEMRKYGLDVATTQIHNSKNQNQVWDETGMTFRQWNEQKQDYDKEQIKIINNLIAFTDQNGEVKMALGKIPIDKSGNYCFGLNAECLQSKLVMSENLWIENDSGTYKFNDEGFVAKSGNNSVRIQPNNSGELFSIYKGSNKQFYVDSSGNVHFAGDLSGATGTFSGLLSGGSININNTFTVDKAGKVTATSGTFKGDISGSSGTFGGVTIDSYGLSSKQFSIDSYGNARFKGDISGSSGTFGGNISGGSINIGNGTFTVDKYGNMYASSGTFIGNGDGLTFNSNATINALSARISLTADEISSKVSKGDVVSEINQSSDTIYMRAGRFVLEGGDLITDLSGKAVFSGELKAAKGTFDSLVCTGGSKGTISGLYGLTTDWETVNYSISVGESVSARNLYATSKVTCESLTSDSLTSDSLRCSGDISANGIKNRTSTAAANVRCQDGSNGWLAVTSSSSRRYKHDISDIKDDELRPERLYDLSVRQYIYNTDYLDSSDMRYDKTVCGFIAEEIEKYYPIATEYNEFGEVENWNERYIIPPMLALIQQQKKQIDDMSFNMAVMQMQINNLGGQTYVS